MGLLCLLAGAACTKGVEPTIRPCTAAADTVTLALNEYVSLDPTTADSGCVLFPATVLGAEYLLVPQLTSGDTGRSVAFRLFGDTILPVPSASAALPRTARSSAARFHLFLRLGDESRRWGFDPEPDPGIDLPRAAMADPPVYNHLRTFQVCATLVCRRFDRVAARAKAINSTVAIYVDTLAPPNGLDSAAIDSVARIFDQRLYAIDTLAFGRESDIDSNGVVIVLMTNTVNKLIAKDECDQGFIAGFFLGIDIDPAFRTDNRSNQAEIFYSMVADPTGIHSCPHSAAQVEAFVPVTFIHEFQHMISFNEHVLEAGAARGELLWLNEGLSHYAEELGGRSYEPDAAARIDACTRGSIPCSFYGGNFSNSYGYLDSTFKHYLLPGSGIGGLEERGAQWLFVRYLIDQYALGPSRADWDTFTRSLVRTDRQGADNIEAVTGELFENIVSRWALANWVTDIAGVPEQLKYKSWDLHAVFAHLDAQLDEFQKPYPLTPAVSAGRDVNLTGTLRAGSPIYHRATQAPGEAGFTLSFTAPNGGLLPTGLRPRLNVIRLQ